MTKRTASGGPEGRLSVVHYLASRTISQGVMGGMENHVLTLSEHLDHNRFNVFITCPPLNEEHQESELLKRASALGVPVHPFPTGDRGMLNYLKRIFALTRLLFRERADVLHIHAIGFTGLNAFIAALLARVPAIIVTHHAWLGPNPYSSSSRLSLWLEKRLAARMILLYKQQAREMESTGARPERINVVPMGVDMRKFQLRSDARGPDPSVFRLAIVARLVEHKGHEELLRAMSRLISRYPQLRLLIVGDGPERGNIETFIQELQLSAVVEMPGKVPNEQVPGMLRTCQVIALPTSIPSEAFPNALLEGMAMGLAAIGTRYAGIPDIIAESETGLLVEPRDVEGLVKAIEMMVSNPDMTAEMGRKSYARVKQLFSAEVLGQTLTSIYLQAVTKRQQRKAPTQQEPQATLRKL